ncbi:MAG: MFS transporter [Actinobacteria bacterium]|nr:MFS transporter [Actinomycetota bacterium]MBI3688518.1 MFS transporter [Actinomycetota bacterium]
MARRPTMTLVAVGTAVLSYALMQTMVVPALHVLQQDMRTTATWSAWILSVFLLTSAATTPLLSRLADRYGRRRMLLVVLGIYLVGTVGAAAVNSIGLLIACRAVQGVSLAALPISFGVVGDALPAARQRAGHGLVSGAIGVGAGIGLVVGGGVTDHASWRWLFVLTAVLVVVAIGLVARYVPTDRPGGAGSVDLAGAALLALLLVAVLLILTEGPAWGWTDPGTFALFGAALVLLVVLVAVERRANAPLIDPAVVAGGALRAVHVAAFIFGLVSFVFYVSLPAFAQTAPGQPLPGGGTVGYGLGAGVTIAGLILLPGSVVLLPAGPLGSYLYRHFSARVVLLASFLVMAAGAVALAVWNATGWELTAGYLVVGAGSGVVLGSLPALISSLTEARRAATANGVNTVLRTVGGVVGSQLTVALLAAQHAAGSAVPARAGFTTAFLVAAGFAMVGGLACWAVTVRFDGGK